MHTKSGNPYVCRDSICVYVYMCVCVYMYTYVYIYACVCVCVCISDREIIRNALWSCCIDFWLRCIKKKIEHLFLVWGRQCEEEWRHENLGRNLEELQPPTLTEEKKHSIWNWGENPEEYWLCHRNWGESV